MASFNIIILGKTFKSNEDGLLNLNDIWRGCKLPESKRTKNWRNEKRDYLSKNGHLVSFKEGMINTVYADELATIMYASFVSMEFEILVHKAFIALRNGNIKTAVALANSTQDKCNNHFLKVMDSRKGMLWDDACARAGLPNPRITMEYLQQSPSFTMFDRNRQVNRNHPTASKYFYNVPNPMEGLPILKVTQLGRRYLMDNSEEIIKQVELYKVQRKLKVPFSDQ